MRGLLARAKQIIDSNSTRRHAQGDHVVGLGIRIGEREVEARPHGAELAA